MLKVQSKRLLFSVKPDLFSALCTLRVNESPMKSPGLQVSFTGLGLVFTMRCSLLTLLCKTCMFDISNQPKLLFIFDQE